MSANKSKTRIYAVTKRKLINDANTRLIRASSATQALSFVAKDELDSSVASQEDLVAALRAGVQVEDINPQLDDGQVDLEEMVPKGSLAAGHAEAL